VVEIPGFAEFSKGFLQGGNAAIGLENVAELLA
jgi:hypothetical protein